MNDQDTLDRLAPIELKAFLPARDFERSKRSIRTLASHCAEAAKEIWRTSTTAIISITEKVGFFLQRPHASSIVRSRHRPARVRLGTGRCTASEAHADAVAIQNGKFVGWGARTRFAAMPRQAHK
jgi:hypothetical protein